MTKWKITDSNDVAMLLISLGEWIKSDCQCSCLNCKIFRIACSEFRRAQNKTNKAVQNDR